MKEQTQLDSGLIQPFVKPVMLSLCIQREFWKRFSAWSKGCKRYFYIIIIKYEGCQSVRERWQLKLVWALALLCSVGFNIGQVVQLLPPGGSFSTPFSLMTKTSCFRGYERAESCGGRSCLCFKLPVILSLKQVRGFVDLNPANCEAFESLRFTNKIYKKFSMRFL